MIGWIDPWTREALERSRGAAAQDDGPGDDPVALDEPRSQPQGRPATWTEEILTPVRLGALGGLSLLATGLVIWAGATPPRSAERTAALLRGQVVVYVPPPDASPAASGAAGAVTTQSPGAASAPPAVSPTSTPAAAATPASTATRTKPRPAATKTAASSGTTGATGSTGATGAAGGTGATGAGATTGATTTTGTGAAKGTKIKHVFIITLASPGYEETWGAGSAAPYLTTTLRPLGTLLTNYYGIGHPDLPNYIAMISGQAPNAQTDSDCPTFSPFPASSKLDATGHLSGAGCVYPINVLTVADQLTSAGDEWHAYVEDLGSGPAPVASCRHPALGQPDDTQQARVGDAYATRHNPFVYFDSLVDLGDCASDDLPLTQLSSDLASVAKTPNYSFIVPNLCHDGTESPCLDGEPGGLASADAFLKQWVPVILASPAYRKDGLLVITFSDAPASDTSGCCTAPAGTPTASVKGGGRVGALLLSPFVTPGGTSATPYDHYSLLRTVEDLFGLGHLAGASDPGVQSFSGAVLKGVLPTPAG